MCLEVPDGGRFILAHEARVAGDIRGKDGDEPPPHCEICHRASLGRT
jgi:hypothetical protein